MSQSLGTIVVGGGTGFIGTHLSNLLKSKGYGITLISRMPGPQRMTWADLNATGLPKDTVAVVNLAGQNVLDMTQRWNAGFKQNVYNSRINTTQSLAQAIMKAQNRPRAFISISGVGIYKPDKEKAYSEDEPSCDETDFFTNLCHKWEESAKLSAGGVRQVTIRSGVVLGRTGGMIKQLYLPFFFGLGGPISPGDQFLPWIHITDLTRLIMFGIESDKAQGVFNGVAPEVITNKQFTEAFAKAIRRPALIPVPQFVLNILLSTERANMLTQGQKVLPSRAKAEGFEYKYPDIASACNEVIRGSS